MAEGQGRPGWKSVLVGLLLLATSGVASATELGRPAVDFRLPDLLGKPVRVSEYRGQVILLNLWATWCPPCRVEMPTMEAAYRRYRDRGFVVLAVSVDTGPASEVAAFVRGLALSFPVLLDPEGATIRSYRAPGLPLTVLIDRRGVVMRRVPGALDWDGEAAREAIEALLK